MKRRRTKTEKIVYTAIVVIVALFSFLKTHGLLNFNNISGLISQKTSKVAPSKGTTSKEVGELANIDFTSGSSIVKDLGKSSIDMSAWKSSMITYSPLDSLNRVGTATAYLSKDNLGKSEGRDSQTWKPTGWNNQPKKVNGKRVFPVNRGHLIAYTISFNLNDKGEFVKGHDGSLDNPKNLFTQSAYSNQVTFQHYEGMIRDSLKSGHKVIYKVTPVFRGNELMARGAHLEAVSDDKSLNFNVYIFNVQPGLSFDYSTGRSQVDPSMKIKDN